ncbi:MAG: ABC transporter ATP-binding protein [Lachnospiraceae bacterium]|nr:ABC transporter ATP-binding protein [Lachnospiraceae bacterium]
MKKLAIYLKDYKKETIFAPLFKMLEACFELFIPLVVAAIIDKGIGREDPSYILKMCVLMVALGVTGLICSITAQFFAAKAAVGFATKLRHALFTHIQSLSYTEMDTIGTSTLITRMTSDINQAQSGVNMVLRLFLRSPFIVFGAMIMAFTVDAKAAVVFAMTIPILSVVVFAIILFSIPLYKKVQTLLDKVLGITRETLTGVRVIRAFHLEQQEIEHFDEENEALKKMQIFVGRFSAFLNPLTYVIINGATIALIFGGALRVDSGAITRGEVVALVNYMSQILVELVKLANLIVTVTKAVACANRIQDVFEVTSTIREKEDAQDHFERKKGEKTNKNDAVVIFRNVCLTYAGAGAEALTDIDFTVKEGETVGIIGGTGSGKSSVINLIPRFYDATKGEVLVDGINVKDYPIKDLRDKVGVVPQKAVLFQGTVRDNLKWGDESANDNAIWEALKTAQAEEFIRAKDGKLNEPVSQGGKNFSGGQRQRLTIARALVKKPRILILDDSASALDYLTDLNLRKAIAKMEGLGAVFIVSQRTSSIRNADRILVLEDGAVAGIGTHEELLENCSVYQEIHHSQSSDA